MTQHTITQHVCRMKNIKIEKTKEKPKRNKSKKESTKQKQREKQKKRGGPLPEPLTTRPLESLTIKTEEMIPTIFNGHGFLQIFFYRRNKIASKNKIHIKYIFLITKNIYFIKI